MREVYSKKLCMNELAAVYFKTDDSVYFEAEETAAHASFRYIVQGEVCISTTMRQLILSRGTLYYIPEGISFSAAWQDGGDGGIEFYSFDIISDKYDVGAGTGYFEIQSLPALSAPETWERFAEIFRLFRSGERVDRIRAVGKYYEFYADALPHLRAEESIICNEAVLCAVSYMKEHYQEEFSVAELAAACSISESRLYHLFCEELGSTPVYIKNKIRTERAAQLLKNTDASISAIAEAVGFHSAAYFRETFKQYTGTTPAAYRKAIRT